MGNKLNKLLEVFAIAIFVACMYLSFLSFLVWPLVIYFYPYSAAGIIPYILWMSYELYTGCTIERKSNWVRKMYWWKCCRDYFPARLIKTADLPEGRNYILAMHHHGFIACSLISFLTEANNVGKLFPGIDIRAVSRFVVNLPIFREIILSLGICNASESDIIHVLQRNTSTGLVVTPGGSREIPLSKPGSNEFKIFASKRKGFVKVALKTGSALVPVVSFGNTEVTVQVGNVSTNLLNFIPIFRTAYPDGFRMINLLPKRLPLNTIVGEPIIVPKVENPSSELIDQYHAQFYDAFRQLFEKYKHEYSPAGSSYKLIIV